MFSSLGMLGPVALRTAGITACVEAAHREARTSDSDRFRIRGHRMPAYSTGSCPTTQGCVSAPASQGSLSDSSSRRRQRGRRCRSQAVMSPRPRSADATVSFIFPSSHVTWDEPIREFSSTVSNAAISPAQSRHQRQVHGRRPSVQGCAPDKNKCRHRDPHALSSALATTIAPD